MQTEAKPKKSPRGSKLRPLLLPAFTGAWLLLGYACAVSDDNPLVPRREIDLNSSDALVGADGELLVDANGAPICASYGGSSQAQTLALAVLQSLKSDCRISATIVQTTTQNHGIQCFQAFVAASFQCDGANLQAGYKDDNGAPCSRPIDDTLSDADFDAFVEDYRAVLKDKKISDGDIELIVPALLNQRTLVVGDNVQEGKYTTCAGNCKDAGAACVRDAGPPPPKDAGGVDANKPDTGAPKDSGSPVDSGPKDSGASQPDTGPKDSATD